MRGLTLRSRGAASRRVGGLHHLERAAHALRQAKKAFVSALPSIASRKSSKSTSAYCAARNERKKSRTSFGSKPSWRLAPRWGRPRQRAPRREDDTPPP